MDVRLRVVEFGGVWHRHVTEILAATHRAPGPSGRAGAGPKFGAQLRVRSGRAPIQGESSWGARFAATFPARSHPHSVHRRRYAEVLLGPSRSPVRRLSVLRPRCQWAPRGAWRDRKQGRLSPGTNSRQLPSETGCGLGSRARAANGHGPPRCREVRSDLSASHSITSSAATRSVRGTVRPSALAVLRLMINSNVAGVCAARSAGLSPRRMRLT